MSKAVMQVALDALKNGRNVRQGMGSTKLQISFENAAIAALEQELAKPEQELDYPPECTTPEMKIAYSAGWFKALEVQRNKQQALDKKADNARELGLDYEPYVSLTDEGKTEQEPVNNLSWFSAPKKTEWGEDMVCAEIEIDKDHILTLYCELSQIHKIPNVAPIQRLDKSIREMQRLGQELEQEPFNRLIRIMGTFDLSTGHADCWDDLLESLESELRDVLGHYREALKQDHGFDRTASHMAGEYVDTAEQEPVAWMRNNDVPNDTKWGMYSSMQKFPSDIPLYTAPPKRKWQGLTYEDRIELHNLHKQSPITYIQGRDFTEAKLKEKNNV